MEYAKLFQHVAVKLNTIVKKKLPYYALTASLLNAVHLAQAGLYLALGFCRNNRVEPFVAHLLGTCSEYFHLVARFKCTRGGNKPVVHLGTNAVGTKKRMNGKSEEKELVERKNNIL